MPFMLNVLLRLGEIEAGMVGVGELPEDTLFGLVFHEVGPNGVTFGFVKTPDDDGEKPGCVL